MTYKTTKWPYYIRKTHRFLGVFLGIQFLLWTLGGLYFSWTNIDAIHGDFERNAPPALPMPSAWVSPNIAIEALKTTQSVDSIDKLQMATVLGKAHYQIVFWQGQRKKVALADAASGLIRPPLTAQEATDVAKAAFNAAAPVVGVEYLSTTHGHHEYREKPLPAYAITFEHPTQTVVYVAAEWGTVQSFRNKGWRIFDFLWMLHTMDFKGRDNINNMLLRGASILGLVTIASGFALFFVSRKRKIS